MNRGRTVFAQIIEYFSHNEFHRFTQVQSKISTFGFSSAGLSDFQF